MQEGTYKARAQSWDFGETGTGKAQVIVRLAFFDDEGERIGYLNWYGMLEGSRPDIALEALRRMGFRGDDPFEIDALPNEVEAVVEHDGQGLKVKYINSGGGIEVKNRLSEAKKAQLRQRLRGSLAALDQKQRQSGGGDAPPDHGGYGRQAQQGAAAAQRRIDAADDDIPF
jgi:hypothetical protein